MKKAVLSLVVLTSILASCGNQNANTTPTTSQTQLKLPDERQLLYPGNKPVVEVKHANLSHQSSDNPLSKDGWVKYTFSNGESITYRNLHGTAVYGDMAIAPSTKMPDYIKYVEDILAGKNGLSSQSIGLNPQGCSVSFIGCVVRTTAYMWAGKRVPYTFTAGFTSEQINQLQQQIDEWNSSPTAIKWVPATSQDSNPVTINPVNVTEYCGQAMVGFQGRVAFTYTNYINININPGYSCVDAWSGTMQHEMGHVVGLPHEQDRCDRDNFVTIGDTPSNPKCGSDFSNYTLFDYDSIMLYETPHVYGKNPAPAAGTYRGTYSVTLPRKAHLSQGDIETINGIYLSPYNPRP